MADCRKLVLVRHGLPDSQVDRPAATWSLREVARPDVILLAQAMPSASVIVASSEPKAVQAAEIVHDVVGGELHLDARLREVVRPDEWATAYEEQAVRYLTRGHEPGWEPAHRVRARMAAAMRDLPAGAVVVGHGLSLTLYTATRARFDHVRFWRGLRMPDAWVTSGGAAPRRIEPDSSSGGPQTPPA